MTVEDNEALFGWLKSLVLEFMLDAHGAREQLVKYAVTHPGRMRTLNRMAWILSTTCPDPECISQEDQEDDGLCPHCGKGPFVVSPECIGLHPAPPASDGEKPTMLVPETPSQYKARWLASIKMLMERHGIEAQDLCEPGDIPTICVKLRRIYADYVRSGGGYADEWVHCMEVNDPRLDDAARILDPLLSQLYRSNDPAKRTCPGCDKRLDHGCFTSFKRKCEYVLCIYCRMRKKH